MEAPALPELHGRGKAQAQQLVQREAQHLWKRWVGVWMDWVVVVLGWWSMVKAMVGQITAASLAPALHSNMLLTLLLPCPRLPSTRGSLTVYAASWAAAEGQTMGSTIELRKTGRVSSAETTNCRRHRAVSARPASTKSVKQQRVWGERGKVAAGHSPRPSHGCPKASSESTEGG